jgi:HPt (histidine-containing phosphotransfer) domain-containing protein
MTANNNSEVIDMRIAGQLIAHKRMGQTAFERLVPVFVEEANMLLSQIRCAIEASDSEGLKLTAHKLKGSASVIGASEIRDITVEMMEQAEDGKLPSSDLAREMDSAIKRFRAAADDLVGH